MPYQSLIFVPKINLVKITHFFGNIYGSVTYRHIILSFLASLLFSGGVFANETVCGNTTLPLTFKKALKDALGANGKMTIGPRRLVTNQQGTAWGGTSRRFIQQSPLLFNQAELVIETTGGRGKADFIICSTDAKSKQQHLATLRLGKGISNHKSILLKQLYGQRLSIRVKGYDFARKLDYSILLNVPDQGKPWVPDTHTPMKKIKGIADLHVHQVADNAFAGGWFYGSHKSGNDKKYLAPDNGHHGITLCGYDVYGGHKNQKSGYPDFQDWPSAYDISHQQVGATWLKQAHERGLKLIVASVVSNQWLCSAVVLSGNQRNDYSCNDMEAIKRQIYDLHQFANHNSWYVIVRDPWEARRVINQGKLAVMIAVEISNVLPPSDGDFIRQIDELYAMDVRSIQLAHEVNSLYAGAAFHAEIFKFMGKVKALYNWDITYASDGKGEHNQIGLSPVGEKLLDEMVRLHIPIDLAHLSLKSQRQIVKLAKEKYNNYPLFNSHTRIRALLTKEGLRHLKEHNTNDDILAAIKNSGGIIGLRTGDNAMLGYNPKQDKKIANDCDGSSKSFAQFYQYAADKGVATAFASDFNGFITQMTPRFGSKACSTSANATEDAKKQSPFEKDTPDYVMEYSTKGLAHIGLLPAVQWDLKHLGVNTNNLDKSTENFLLMWQRTYNR